MDANKSAKETNKRSIVKTISWRICATFTTTLIVYLFTRKITLSLGVGFIEAIAKMILYYVHERMWERTTWGYVRHPLSELPVTKLLTDDDLSEVHNKLKDLGYIDA